MLKLVITASALALSAPVMAQELGTDMQSDSTVQETAPTAEETMPQDDMAAEPMATEDAMTDDQATTAQTTPDPMAQDEMQSNAAMAEAEGGNDPSAVDQFVEQQFPSFDGDSSGDLSAEEFAAWIAPMHQAEVPTEDPEAVKTWTSQAFVQADTDQSASVSKEELKTLLAG